MGIIFDIKEFSVHDGPGVRQTVFLKGCPLRCTWCHNPEGQDPNRMLLIRRHECLDCNRCVGVCDEMDADEKNAGSKIANSCMRCGKCINTCPKHIRWICGEELTPNELAERINRNADIYDDMDGGVTFSGGEPLMQGEFLIDTMKLLPKVHKTIETSGYADGEIFKRAFELAELTMCDIKIMDDDMHKQYTGVSNSLIHKNIEYMKQSGKEFVVRIPMIPGVTDTEKNLKLAAKFLQDSKNLKFVELLSYNTLAGAKYEWVNREYKPNLKENDSVANAVEIFTSVGLNCKWSKND